MRKSKQRAQVPEAFFSPSQGSFMLLLRSRPLDWTTRLGALGALVGTGFLFAAAPAHADPSPALDRFSLSVGAFNADPKFNASVSTPYGSLQSGDIKPGRVTMPRISADMLIGDSQGISFDYYQYKRDYTGGVASNNSFGSLGSLNAFGNASINTKLDFAKLSYKWWLGTGNTVFGLGAGAAYYRATLGASATAVVNGQVGTLWREFERQRHRTAARSGRAPRHHARPAAVRRCLGRVEEQRPLSRQHLQRLRRRRMVSGEERGRGAGLWRDQHRPDARKQLCRHAPEGPPARAFGLPQGALLIHGDLPE
jgi:hypothetical protein